MQIDVAAHLEKLIFLHDTLIIPAFGGFTSVRAPAAVDYAGGAVTPPSKTLTFNENLTVDDGVLVDELSRAYAIPADEARAAIQAFVDQIQVQLNQREIVTLAGVGRLYKNYVQKIQFLPDATNFHAGSYGLPPLQFSPIARSREVMEMPPAPAPATGSSAALPAEPAKTAKPAAAIPPLPPPPAFITEPYTAPRSSSGQLGTGIGIGLLVCAVAFSLWWWQHKKGQNLQNQETAELLDDKPAPGSPLSGMAEIAKMAEKKGKNTPKAETAPAETPVDDMNDDVEEATAKKVEVLRRQNEAPRPAEPATRPDTRRCILLIATLQDRNNADRLIAKLKGAGYDVYYRQLKGHQIGIQFDYTDPKTVTEKKEELIRFTGEKGIFVKQK